MTTMTINDITNLRTQISDAYRSLSLATSTAQDADAKVADAKVALARRKQEVINQNSSDMKALGSNEAVREASIALLCTAEAEVLVRAETAQRQARDVQEIARLEVDRCRTELRTYEVEVGAMREMAEARA